MADTENEDKAPAKKAVKKAATKKAAAKKAAVKKAPAKKAAPKKAAPKKAAVATAAEKPVDKAVAEKTVGEQKSAPVKAVKPGARTLKITLVRSKYGRLKSHKACVAGLGLRKMHQTVEVIDTPENRGMINKVHYLLNVEEA